MVKALPYLKMFSFLRHISVFIVILHVHLMRHCLKSAMQMKFIFPKDARALTSVSQCASAIK